MMLYPGSLKGAATRSELTRIERDIVQARDNIRYLESELAVRASMRQLEQWNADTFGYSAPDAAQYLENERRSPRCSGGSAKKSRSAAKPTTPREIGRASGRERVWPYV